MYKYLFVCFLVANLCTQAQPVRYTIANTHSHNDYEQSIPFRLAYAAGFGSIEADIFLVQGELIVGHDWKEVQAHRTLEEYYIRPLLAEVRRHHGHPYADPARSLQMLIDIKTDSIHTVDSLVGLLARYPELSNNMQVRWVITGNRPDTCRWGSYPLFVWFDGVLFKEYNAASLSRIAMMSDDLRSYTAWNGKSNIPAPDLKVLQAAVRKSHALQKPVRFWDAPDFINAWIQLMHLQVDYINTDHIRALQDFMEQLPARTWQTDSLGKEGVSRAGTAGEAAGRAKLAAGGAGGESVYRPTYKRDGIDRPIKNLILLIGDGTGLAQLYAGYTANRKVLNIFAMRNIGLSMTSSANNYVTDSAPGSTAFSSGEKTNNRYVGADTAGAPLRLLPAILAERKMVTGLVTCGDIADATPADFYAHQTDRENSLAILRDLRNAPVNILMGCDSENVNNVALLSNPAKKNYYGDVLQELQGEYTVAGSVDAATDPGKKYIVVEKRAGLSMLNGRGDWLPAAFSRSLETLAKNKTGFFLMTEGAQVDYGGHANSLPYVVTEVLDLDRVVGKALQYADADGETLVLVTADHETGGLSLLDGDYSRGYVAGQFSTNDHTAIPVPVFAYGPRSGLFRGVYENTEIFRKILQAFAR